jgi:hypothetical protein
MWEEISGFNSTLREKMGGFEASGYHCSILK